MSLYRLLQNRMHRIGSFAVALFAVASMPLMHLSADEDMVVICTGTGMKTVSLAQFLGTASDNEEQPAPDAAASDGMCPLCLLAHQVAIVPQTAFVNATDLSTHAPQAPPVHTPVLGGFHRPQQARAPPSNA